jgi:hypothetical protein
VTGALRSQLALMMILTSATAAIGEPDGPPIFAPSARAVSTWRKEAAASLQLNADQRQAIAGPSPNVARCVKLNNYWCVKKAGWNGEIAADQEGHVAFASAVEGAAVAALLLKRYYIDFDRKSALAIVAHWAPCAGPGLVPDVMSARRLAPKGLGNTLRGRWLAGHARGFTRPLAGRKAPAPRRSVVATRLSRMMPAPMIAAGLGIVDTPITLDALLAKSPNAPASRSMLGLPGHATAGLGGCDGGRTAAYAAKAAEGIAVGPDGDLHLFGPDGTPTPALATMMGNMARVEIGPMSATRALIDAGIADALRADRNPPKATP